MFQYFFSFSVQFLCYAWCFVFCLFWPSCSSSPSKVINPCSIRHWSFARVQYSPDTGSVIQSTGRAEKGADLIDICLRTHLSPGVCVNCCGCSGSRASRFFPLGINYSIVFWRLKSFKNGWKWPPFISIITNLFYDPRELKVMNFYFPMFVLVSWARAKGVYTPPTPTPTLIPTLIPTPPPPELE